MSVHASSSSLADAWKQNRDELLHPFNRATHHAALNCAAICLRTGSPDMIKEVRNAVRQRFGSMNSPAIVIRRAGLSTQIVS